MWSTPASRVAPKLMMCRRAGQLPRAACAFAACSAFETNLQDTQVDYQETARQNFEKGEEKMASESWNEAIKFFDYVKNKFPYSKYAVLAELRIADAQTDDVLNASDAVITASGTATVQTALHGKPMVVIYKVTPLTYRLARRLAHVDTYAMVNLIAGERVVVELIQEACTADAIADEAVRLLTDAAYRDTMTAALANVRARLGGPGASDRAAEAVLELARHRVP